MELSCMRCNDGTLSEIHAKAYQHCQAERLANHAISSTKQRSSVIRQSYHCATNFDRMLLLQLMDILNTLLKLWVCIWHLSLKRLNCRQKVLYKFFIRYSWIFNEKLHVHLKKWTSKFKLLYFLNHISCFKEIFSILYCVNTRVLDLKVSNA